MTDLLAPPLLHESIAANRANIPRYRAIFDDWLVGIEQDQICAWWETTPQQLQWSIDQSRRDERAKA